MAPIFNLFGIPLPGMPEYDSATAPNTANFPMSGDPSRVPASAPVAGQATSPFPSDMDEALKQQSYLQSVTAMKGISDLQDQQKNAESQIANAMDRQAQLHMTYNPQMEHGAGFGGFMRNLGRGALLGLAGTGPGRAVEASIYARPREEYQHLADKVSTLRGGEMERAKELETMGQIAYHAPVGYGRVLGGEAQKLRAATYQEWTQARAKIDQVIVDIKKHGQELQERIANKKLSVEQARTEMMKYVADKQAASRTDVANIMSGTQEDVQMQRSSDQEMKQEADHWFQSWTGLLPQKPIKTPAGRQGGASDKTPPRTQSSPAGTGGSVVDQLVKKHGG